MGGGVASARATLGAAAKRVPKVNVPPAVAKVAQAAASEASSFATGGIRLGRKAVTLQLQAAWQVYGTYVMVGAAGVGVYALWRSMYGVAGWFVDLSETMAEAGFLGLAISLGVLGAMWTRSLYHVEPDAAYRLAMRALNAHAGALELLGAPVIGSEVRAFVQSGGKLRMSSRWRPKFASRRIHMIFPVKGTEARGIASLEVKKRVRFPRSQMEIKLLAVDLPNSRSGELGRVFVVGDTAAYSRGSRGAGLMSELRDPLLRVMGAEGDFNAEDDADEEAEAAEEARKLEAEAQEAERSAREAQRQQA